MFESYGTTPQARALRGMLLHYLVCWPCRDALANCFGHAISDEHVQPLVAAVAAVKDWQAKLNPRGSAGPSAQATRSAGPATGSGRGGDAGAAKEFGADLEFLNPDDASLAESGPLGLLGLGLGLQGLGQGSGFALGGGGSGLEPSPWELQQMVRQGAAATPAGATGAAVGAAAAGGRFGGGADAGEDEYLGEEYEEGKRLKEVRGGWHVCGRGGVVRCGKVWRSVGVG